MNSDRVRVRFAPSPTGHLHLGNVRTALFNWLYARHHGGTFILRLEDTDEARSTQESVVSVLEDLRWLGLHWDEGPETGGDFGPYRQTERYGIYAEYLNRLVEEGKAYPCFCSQEELNRGREEAKAAGRTYIYPGTCRHLTAEQREAKRGEGIRPAVRLYVKPQTVSFTDMVRGPVSVHSQTFGDWILSRPDGSPTYNFAVVIDDALMAVTHVIRGEDHLSNTPKQVVLYEALGLPIPRFAHLSMILGPDGGKLSKRHGDVSLDAFRSRGFLPEAMVNGLALLGWSDSEGQEILTRDELVQRFDLERINKSAAVFDEGKLRHLNAAHLKAYSDEEVEVLIRPHLVQAGRLPAGPLAPEVQGWAVSLAGLLRQRIDLLTEAVPASDPVFLFDPTTMDEAARAGLADPGALRVLRAFAEEAGRVDLSVPGAYRELVTGLKERLKVKGKALFHPIRLGVTAADSGPDLERLVPILALGSRLPLPMPVLHPAERARRVLDLLQSHTG